MPPRSSEFLKESLAPLALVVSVGGVFFGVIESVTKAIDAVENHFYLIVCVCYVAALLILWQWKWNGRASLRKRQFKAALSVTVTIAFLCAVGFRYYEANLKKTGHPNVPMTAMTPRASSSHVTVPPRKAGPSQLGLESLHLNTDMSSFKEEDARLFAGPGAPVYRTFAYDPTISMAFHEGSCAGVNGDQPISDVLPLLRTRLVKIGRQDLNPYVATAADLSRVVRERRDIFSQLVFSPGELTQMMKASPGDYDLVHEWLLTCIGLQQPVITVVVHNGGTESVLLTHVVYHVLDVGQVNGGGTGAVTPDRTYDHELVHEVGDQPWELAPPQQIAAKENVSFNLRLFSAHKESGLCWLLKIELVAVDGEFAMSKPIQIIMSK